MLGKMKPQNIKLTGFLLTILLISVITVVMAQVSQTHVISAGVSNGYDHTIWSNGAGAGTDVYYCKNAYGALESTDGDASVVLEYALKAGGSIKVLSGDYLCDDAISFGSRSVVFEGSGVNTSVTAGMPDEVPDHLYGTVFHFDGPGNLFNIIDANGISMSDFGIELAEEATDAGIAAYATGDDGIGLVYGSFENIFVLGASATDYAFYLCSFQHLTVKGLRSWNSGFMWLRGWDTNPYDYGNSIFTECYTQVNRALGVPAVVFIELEFGNKINLLQFDRLQLNNLGTDCGIAMLRVDDCRYTTFVNLDIETLSVYPIVNNANCRGITYVNPYVWVNGNGGDLDFLGDYTTIMGGILDGCDGTMTNGTNLQCYNTYRYLG